MAKRPAEAVISLDASGRYVGANKPALELLGVTLAELLASSPDRFAIRSTNQSELAALRAEWESAGSRLLVGTAGLKRANGTTIRVSYAIETAGSGFRARLWQVEGSPSRVACRRAKPRRARARHSGVEAHVRGDRPVARDVPGALQVGQATGLTRSSIWPASSSTTRATRRACRQSTSAASRIS